MKRYYLTTAIVCLVMLLAFSFVYNFWEKKPEYENIVVGFISENDEMTASTYNFQQSRNILENEFEGHIEIITRTNVQNDETEEALRALIRSGCNIIFANTRSSAVKEVSAEFPSVQFCQLSSGVAAALKSGGNYHTFSAKFFEAHYVGGVVAGMKLREMIDSGLIQPDEALVGYVGSYQTAEIISGFTAFLLGVRSEVPEATMRVRYTNALSNFSREKASARALIEEGCVIIAQNSGTTGPVAACQESPANHRVYHIGFNETMIDTGSAATLVTPRSNWDPYIVGAVRAMMENKVIEDVVSGEIHGNDVCAGFAQGWLEIYDLNESIAAEGTKSKVESVIRSINDHELEIFRGNYIGVDPDNMRIKIDLNEGYAENSSSSKPTFHYILRDVITVEK